jgi:uncharacterized membrane protein
MGGGGMPGEVTSDDKLWALLAYLFSPLVPVLILLMEDKKNRPYLKTHNVQALILGALNWILVITTSWVFVGCCTGLVLSIAQIYYGIQAYQGKPVNIPLLTDFVKNQGWA